MEDKAFVWTPELNKRLIQFRIDNDWLFRRKKQPWGAFHKILIDGGFPTEMTINHVRKKWSYMYDTYKIAKKAKNKNCKYYKLFEKLYAKTTILDKYECWSDEWRIKLIASICEAKEKKLDYAGLWKWVETALRSQDLPLDCCIQDIKGLWWHIRMTFNRKHRLKLKKGAELSNWPPYESMTNYFKKFEPDYLMKLESESGSSCMIRVRKSSKNYLNKNQKNDEQANEFQWSKDITESFIQIRLQNDWLFRERKWAWNDLLAIMRDEYGFPSSLTGRDICRKWASTFSEYQKAKATNNESWLYYKLFEVYLGEGILCLNPSVGWKDEWIFNLIRARSDYENLFKLNKRDPTCAWREVEKRLRSMGLPLDHSLLKLPEVWGFMIKTYRWKRKFADKGILNEQWPFYDAMAEYQSLHDSTTRGAEREAELTEQCGEGGRASDDEGEEDMKLTELKQRLLRPKLEREAGARCRACAGDDGRLDMFRAADDGLNLADKLKLIAGVQVEESDSLPSQICPDCARELENAYKFRRKCQESDEKFKSGLLSKIKTEDQSEHMPPHHTAAGMLEDRSEVDEKPIFDDHYDDPPSDAEPPPKRTPPTRKDRPTIRKKVRKQVRYNYWKVCEVCGKYTKNLVSHLDTHASGREHACGDCGKRFKFRSGLLIHRASHDPTPKKTCEVCGKTFHVMAQYRKHFVYHANERRFECPTCGKRFNTMDILRVHARIHTDERPFACDHCGKTFRTAGCVSRHKRIVHRSGRDAPAASAPPPPPAPAPPAARADVFRDGKDERQSES